MAEVHDPRRIPLDPEPADAGLLARIRRALTKGRETRTERETKAQITNIQNRPLRMAIARRQVKQPGQHPDVLSKALAMLGRVGRGASV